MAQLITQSNHRYAVYAMKLYLKGKFIYEQSLVIEKSVEITIYLADTNGTILVLSRNNESTNENRLKIKWKL